MKLKLQILYLLILFSAFQYNLKAQNNLKSIQGNPVPIDTVGDKVTSPFIISDGGDNVYGKWFINDNDPTGWEIYNDTYDNETDNYVDEIIGNRKDGDPNNTNSFRLWNPQDSGVVWNVTSPIVKFKVKITDGQDWTFGNEGNLGIYFWVTIWDDHKMNYMSRKVRYNKGPVGVLDGGVHWSDYTPHGLGEDVDDGKWHEITVNLKHDIQESRDLAYSNGDSEAGKYWKFYTITAVEVRAVHIFFDDITVLPETSTGIEKNDLGNEISLFPNPSDGIISVVSAKSTESFIVYVYNMAGSLVASFSNVNPGTKLNLSNLSEGTYMIKFRNKKNSFVKKLVIK